VVAVWDLHDGGDGGGGNAGSYDPGELVGIKRSHAADCDVGSEGSVVPGGCQVEGRVTPGATEELALLEGCYDVGVVLKKSTVFGKGLAGSGVVDSGRSAGSVVEPKAEGAAPGLDVGIGLVSAEVVQWPVG